MESLYLLAALACPIGMGLMMWFMMRGHHNHGAQPNDQQRQITELRSEVDKLRKRNRSETDSNRQQHS